MTKIEVLEREHISELVEQAGSVYQLSKKTGLQQTQISNFIKGVNKPSLQSLLKLNEFKSQEVDCEIINS
jgi:transcriptional regulator with XRE-family HTH domain